jgi:uncharacterized lipoprotein YajG
MKKLILLPTLLLLLNCAQNKNTLVSAAKEPQTKNTMLTKTVDGTVVDILQGKDGYTAKLKSSTNEIYFVTISHTNLKNPAQYKTVTTGDKLKVSGDFWKMEKENHITVREIL